jgi:hypothetical protein
MRRREDREAGMKDGGMIQMHCRRERAQRNGVEVIQKCNKG